MNDDATLPSGSGWRGRLQDRLARWVGWSHDHYVLVLLAASVLTAGAGFFAFKLVQDVRTDFATLLPDDDRSVRDLRELSERYGGSVGFTILIESPDFEKNKQFVQRLAATLGPFRKEWGFREFRYKQGPEREFVEDRALLLVDVEDLEEIERRLKARTRWEKCAKSPFCVQLDEKPVFDIADIEAKYKSVGDEPEAARNRDGYLSDENGTTLALNIDLETMSGALGYTRRLIRFLDEQTQTVGGEIFGGGDFKVTYWSVLIKRLVEYESIIDEAVRTAGLTIFLVCLVIYLYFRRFRPVVFMGLSVLVAIVWTFAVTWFHIGYLNQQTAFLGSIIIGNGINFSLIFMARYLEERRRGEQTRRALTIAARNTGGATVTAALATAIAYGVLIFARFKGFSHFGFMGSIGMMLCWIFSFALCPALLAFSEKIRPFVTKHRSSDPAKGRFGSAALARLAERRPAAIVAVCVVLTVLSSYWIWNLLRDPFEYDFRKLRLQLYEKPEMAEAVRTYGSVFAGSGEGAAQAIVTDSLDQSRLVARALQEKSDAPDSTIARVQWYGSLVPENQEARLEIIRRIRRILDTQPIGWMSESQREKVEKFRESTDLEPFTVDDVPPRLLSKLKEKDGTLGRVVLVYPKDEVSLSDGRQLIRFADEVREIPLANGETVYSSGTAVIFADMLKAIVRDGPRITLICYLGVIVALWINFRRLGTTAFLMFFLTYGLVLLGGAMGLLDLKVNFFNYIVIPITVGIGVDYHINVYKRYELDEKRSIADAVRYSGGAVLLCSLTTIIGYGTMMLSETQAMAGFGLMAVIGEITCLTSALLLKPAVLIFEERKRARAA